MAEQVKTQLFPAGDANVLYIVDISGYVFRAYHALPPLSSPSGEQSHAVLGVTSMLLKLIEQRKPALLAVAMDSRTKSFRKEMYEDYKANRPKAPEDLVQQMRRVAEVVHAYGIEVLQQDGMEADDVIGTAVRLAREQGLSVVIVSADKDLLQLVGPDVLMYDSGREKVFGIAETVKKMGVPPEQVRDYLALVGDASDNVPGVPSVGPKTAVKLLTQFADLDALFADLDAVEKVGLRKKLTENRDKAELSRELVTLREDVPVELDVKRLQTGGQDLERLRALFTELGFTRLLAKLPGVDGAESGAELGADAADAGPAAPPVEVEVITTQANLESWVGALNGDEPLATFSISDGPRPLGDDLVGMGLSAGDRMCYVAMGHRYLGVGPQLSHEQASAVLGGLLSNPQHQKILADAKREHVACAAMGVTLEGVAHDVGLSSYLLHADRHGHGLSDVHQALFGEPVEAYAGLMKRTAKTVPPGERPIEEVAALVGAILTATVACAQAQKSFLSNGKTQSLLDDLELPLSRVLSHMERTGITVDVQKLNALGQQAQAEMVVLEQRCKELAGRDFNVASPRQLEAILFDELGLPVIKKTKTARSTDQSVLEELSSHHELPLVILELRMLAKLKSTYLDALPREVRSDSGRVHTDFRQTVAATGRLSSSDPNLQNIPIRSALGRQVREAFVPQSGWQMMSADYSQIELRVLAHISQDVELLTAYREAQDVHVRTAAAIFGVDTEMVSKEMRAQAKTVNFAVIYGQTQFALANNLRISRVEAKRYIDAFFEKYAGVARFMEQVVEEARERGYVQTLSGRIREMPELASANRMKRQGAERIARNTPIQGTAADIIKRAMIDVHSAMQQANMQSRMLLTIHDELVFEAPSEEKDALTELVVNKMQGAMELDVPLVVDYGWASNWGDAH